MRKNHGGDFLREIDEALFRAFDEDASGLYWMMYEFFDSDPNNPLTPRELLEFDAALTEEERLFILLELC